MRPDVVVVLSPGVDDCSRIVNAGEPIEIEAVLTELAVEALDEGVLGRLAGLNEVQLDAAFLRPEEHRLTCQLRIVIADDRSR